MEVMYLKYIHGIRHSIIKEGENIIMSNSKIIPFNSIKKMKMNESVFYPNSKNNTINCTFHDNINEKITIFFFDAIHKNYLSNRKK